MQKLILVLSACAMMLAPPAMAQTPPREVAERVAATVEQNFFDEARARAIAAEVRANAAAGRYDVSNPADLASALTATLAPHDGHFRVEYAPPQPQANSAPAPAFGNDGRAGYGIASVAIHPGGVGVIDMRLFAHFNMQNQATLPAKAAIDAALTLVGGAQALVFDLRDCGGGSPAMVGYLVGHFAPEGADIYNTFRNRGGEGRELPPAPPLTGRRLDTPLFVLISGRTGSACESFAYTLQSAGRATIIGEASGGAANPGGLFPVGEGLAVFVSVGTPINPITGRNWEGAGVQPNVLAPAADALTRARELALETALRAPADAAAATEARWALEELRAARATYPRNLRPYAGDYGARSIAIEGERLVLRRDRRPALVLLPLGGDEFAVTGSTPLQRLAFERDARGRIIAMTLSTVAGQQVRDLRRS